MTERLYYNDSFLREFNAHLLSCEPMPKNSQGPATPERWQIILDHTAFYPSSGGQPYDTGFLGHAKILDVIDGGDQIVHLTDRAVEPGAQHCMIDWPRRFDHMQQHSGQHLLSAVFIRLFQMQTVSFHLGTEASTIDLATAALSAEQLEAAERLCNEIIFEDRPVTVRYGTPAELAALGVRKEVDREGILRAIEIENVDLQPCGGTHVSRTGQIGMVLLRRWEKMKGNCRLEFVCGERARQAARNDRHLLNESAQKLTCGPAELPAGVARVIDERNIAQRKRQQMMEELAALKAKALQIGAEPANGTSATSGSPKLIVEIFPDAEMDYLRMVATNIVNDPGYVALLASRSTGQIVFAQSADLSRDMNQLLRASIAEAGGKGGGSAKFAQGSLKNPEALHQVMDRARHSITERLSNRQS